MAWLDFKVKKVEHEHGVAAMGYLVDWKRRRGGLRRPKDVATAGFGARAARVCSAAAASVLLALASTGSHRASGSANQTSLPLGSRSKDLGQTLFEPAANEVRGRATNGSSR